MPFQGLSPCEATDHARWAVEAMAAGTGVSHVVPEGFEAYARLLHPRADGHAFVEACAVQPWWGGREMLLFDGPIGAVSDIGSPAASTARSSPARRRVVSRTVGGPEGR